MNTYIQKHPFSNVEVWRWGARISGATLFAAWLGLVVGELAGKSFEMPAAPAFAQAGALAIVFVGYLWSVRHELAGGLLAVLGTMVFFVVGYVTTGIVPGLEAMWFAVPGILSLLAWEESYRHGQQVPR